MPKAPRAVAGFLLLAGLLVPAARAESPSPVQDLGTSGEWEPTEGTVVHGLEVELRAEIEVGQRGVLFVEQRAADVRIELAWPDFQGPAEAAWTVDAPLDFDGVEVVLLPPSVRGPVVFRLTIHGPGAGRAAAELRRPRSHLRARFESIAERNENRRRLELLGLLTAAGRAWSRGDGAGRRQALEHYRRAAEIGSPHPADAVLVTQADYAAALLHRLLGESAAALDRARPLLAAWREHGDRPRLSDTWNELGLSLRVEGQLDAARQAFTAGLVEARALADPFRQTVLAGNLCLLDLMQHRLREGIRCYSESLPRVRQIGDRETESAFLVNLAQAQRALGDLEAAIAFYQDALEIQRAERLEKLEAKTLNNLAGLERQRGALETAIDAYQQAAATFERLGDSRWQGRSLHNLATAQLHLGDLESARRSLEKALGLHRRVENRGGEASALKILGHVAVEAGDWSAAREAYDASRELERAAGDSQGVAVAELFLGRTELARGNAAVALGLFDGAVGALEAGSLLEMVAIGQLLRGRALAELGRREEARAAMRGALDTFVSLGHSGGRGHALLALSALEAPARELELLAEASAVVDSVTRNLADADARAFFAGSRRAVQERWAARLVAAGQVTRALEVSEAARAWGLRSVIGAASREAAGLAGRPAALEDIQGLLDEETLFLHFLVGEETSFLFVVGKRQVDVVPLPARSELESRVRPVLEGLRRGVGPGLRKEAIELSARLLGAVWPLLDRPEISRLALVLDGPLHYLPFAALPQPSDPSGVLAERFELVRIPSAGVLALERRRRAARPRASAFAAVLADPVFSPADLRLGGVGFEGAGAIHAASADSPDPLPRLRSSGREVEAVSRAAAGRPVRVATGTEASREWLFSPSVEDVDILHLATHARIDDRVATRSGLELAAVSDTGEPRDGFVASAALRQLRLRAELVVLSACRTALGPEIRGEGLAGLVQAFLEAGGSRVVASLWPVPDRATAELMERFYAALSSGATPASALRHAQLDLRAAPGFEHPVRWAGFVLVGDWEEDGAVQ